MIKNTGYKREAESVNAFLKGIGQYDQATKQYYFTIKDLYKYREMMLAAALQGKYDIDHDFHIFFF